MKLLYKILVTLILLGNLVPKTKGGEENEEKIKLPEAYKAIQIIETGSLKLKEAVYADKDVMRIDSIEDGEPITTLIRRDLGKMYKIALNRNEYIEKVIPIIKDDEEEKFIKIKSSTKENKKYKEIRSLGSGTEFVIEEDSGLPVLIRKNGVESKINWIEYNPGPQDKKIFEIPEGYKKLEN